MMAAFDLSIITCLICCHKNLNQNECACDEAHNLPISNKRISHCTNLIYRMRFLWQIKKMQICNFVYMLQ